MVVLDDLVAMLNIRGCGSILGQYRVENVLVQQSDGVDGLNGHTAMEVGITSIVSLDIELQS